MKTRRGFLGAIAAIGAAILFKVQPEVQATPADVEFPARHPFEVLRGLMKEDEMYAWSWHSNLACPIMDEGVDHVTANRAAARIMGHMFQVNMLETDIYQEYLADRGKTMVERLREMLAIQGASGNWDYDPYMHGMFNGMEVMLATIENREPTLRSAPAEWLADRPKFTAEILAGVG